MIKKKEAFNNGEETPFQLINENYYKVTENTQEIEDIPNEI